MRCLQLRLSFGVRPTHRSPAHARSNECIDKSQLQQVAETQRDLVTEGFDFPLPDCIGVTHRRALFVTISLDPAANFANGHSRQPRCLRDRVKTGIKQAQLGLFHRFE